MHRMMVDFVDLCIGLEQNNEIIAVAEFNTWKSI